MTLCVAQPLCSWVFALITELFPDATRHMPLEVHSPHSGRPVRVRDEDVGRAVRDESGRVFYVLARASGRGHYGSPTRAGSEKLERAYDERVRQAADGVAQASTSATSTSSSTSSNATTGETTSDGSQPAAAWVTHDATGRRRRNPRVAALVVAALLALAAAAVYFGVLPQMDGSSDADAPTDATPPAAQSHADPAGAGNPDPASDQHPDPDAKRDLNPDAAPAVPAAP